jgi:actin-related protein
MFGEGLTTATVMECGEGVTTVVPVVDGYILSHMIKKVDMGGSTVTNYLNKLLFLKGYTFN